MFSFPIHRIRSACCTCAACSMILSWPKTLSTRRNWSDLSSVLTSLTDSISLFLFIFPCLSPTHSLVLSSTPSDYLRRFADHLRRFVAFALFLLSSSSVPVVTAAKQTASRQKAFHSKICLFDSPPRSLCDPLPTDLAFSVLHIPTFSESAALTYGRDYLVQPPSALCGVLRPPGALCQIHIHQIFIVPEGKFAPQSGAKPATTTAPDTSASSAGPSTDTATAAHVATPHHDRPHTTPSSLFRKKKRLGSSKLVASSELPAQPSGAAPDGSSTAQPSSSAPSDGSKPMETNDAVREDDDEDDDEDEESGDEGEPPLVSALPPLHTASGQFAVVTWRSLPPNLGPFW